MTAPTNSMNKNLIEIWKNCSYAPTNWDHMVIIVLCLAMYQSYVISNIMFLTIFSLLFVFKMITYFTYLINPIEKIDALECNRALRIYKLLEDGRKKNFKE